ncbi:hypothetical protein [Bradyrhizobium elkanii]|uniref:hypothetical protein n=1 Tax=Bradyrhizobium elkanii TaxID=29448 RepID=UPI000404AA1D|nr:hypothetical protein [Bradyrhizobium elkanii]
MWKLFATVLALTDTGSVSVSSVVTDFANREACKAAARDLYPSVIERELQGHKISIRAAAECRPDGPPSSPQIAVPSPFPFGPR